MNSWGKTAARGACLAVMSVISLGIGAPEAQAEPWWQGIWATNGPSCRHAGQIGSRADAPISITGAEMLGYENSCRITRADEMADVAAVRVEMKCQSEGSIFAESWLIMGNRLEIWIWRGGAPVRFRRCPNTAMDWLDKG